MSQRTTRQYAVHHEPVKHSIISTPKVPIGVRMPSAPDRSVFPLHVLKLMAIG